MATAAPQVRGERLVAKVVEATLEELAVAGYRALSIEVVAERASVNKTSIYRRWPTKAELVSEALRSMLDDLLVEPDEGTLRADLLRLVGRFRDFAQSARGRGLFRLRAAEAESHELSDLLAEVKRSALCIPHVIVDRAIQRGELPAGSDAELILHCCIAPVMTWVQLDGIPVDDARIGEVIDVVLRGAANLPARKQASPASLPETRLAACPCPGE